MTDMACVEKDNRVTFTCKYSNPNAKLRWFKNHLEIFHGHKYNFEVDDDGTLSLVIWRVSLEDAGRYTCQTDDKETSAWLTVEGPSSCLPSCIYNRTINQSIKIYFLSNRNITVYTVYASAQKAAREAYAH